MIKLSDYIAKRLKEFYQVRNFFMVSGGGAMHLNDSLGQQIPYIANHHEQACAIAAEGYARINQELAVVNVTTGPGGLNCLNGVFGQWTDSVPVLYISGQVKFSTTIAACPDVPLRQLGDQEVDIIGVVKPLVKYAKMVTEPNEIKYHLDKAVYEATTGRMGPVWLDIPMNVQGALIDENELLEFKPPAAQNYDLKIDEVINKLSQAKRPLIIAGHGLTLSKTNKLFKEFIKKTNIPVVTTFNGFDILPDNHKNYVGRIGTIGQRCGNFTLQNADVILCLGTRNNIRQASYNWENYAKNAFKIVVDIDEAELNKPTVKPDIAVCADLKEFLPELFNKINCHSEFISESNQHAPGLRFATETGSLASQSLVVPFVNQVQHDVRRSWLDFCKKLQNKYSFENTPEYEQEGSVIKAYHLVHELTKAMAENDIMVAANGSACVCLFQVGVVKEGQRIFWNSGDASMGYDLPAAIGASVAKDNGSVVCLAGDGSVMMNLQELQTIKHNNLPIKIFVINNDGYASIKQTQRNFFNGRMTGSGSDSGVSVPDFCKLAEGFGLKSVKISKPETLAAEIKEVLDCNEPVVCEVMVENNYSFSPKLSAKKLEDGTMISPSLEDMFPFLDREEYNRNIIESK
ncbi:MAG: thiamine pyrophosphate-binding protein [Candidatus Gastranaerophilales bacterium]|nr:thiamine pyrophosphate-binding protein [Candidatus Gastranaerophilales bacterium]